MAQDHNAEAAAEELKRRHRRFRLARRVALLLVALILLLPLGLGAGAMLFLIRPPCADSGATPAIRNLTYRDILIPSPARGAFRGFFISGAESPNSDPARRSATIIVLPTYNGGRGSLFYEALPLAASGYNVVMFESRSCRGMALSLGYRDTEDAADVLAYLKNNADGIKVDLDRLAFHGFSSAGAGAIFSGARYPEVRAVLAEGGYQKLSEYMGIDPQGRFLETLLQFGFLNTYRLATGDDFSVLNTLDAVSQIPPRPLFLVYGSLESTLEGARQQLAAARTTKPDTNAKLWVVPGANHGGYVSSVGEAEYLRHTLAFYDCALLDHCVTWNELLK